VDVVIELLDARLPESSQNPMLQEMRGDKSRLVLLNKSDLADPEITDAWQRQIDSRIGSRSLAVNATQARNLRRLPELCCQLAAHRVESRQPVRCMVVGIPNVGKSTLINTLLGRSIAKVGNEPAITRGQKQYKLPNNIVVADSPGVLWPKLEDQTAAYRLAASGAIRDTAFEYLDVACFAAGYLASRYPELLRERYDLTELPSEPHEILEELGRRRGTLRKGGIVDMERAATLLLRELQNGKLGRISFEEPDPDPV
jgi:ribosome biogenesis GTPase A